MVTYDDSPYTTNYSMCLQNTQTARFHINVIINSYYAMVTQTFITYCVANSNQTTSGAADLEHYSTQVALEYHHFAWKWFRIG